MRLSDKVINIINKLTTNLQERDEAIKLAMLALLSGESIFLLGPPGVAKSLVSRKMKEAVKDSTNFEYLMNRFSTPDEIFGPISLKKLDEDKYERKVDGYLPSCEIGFLDEIWKASPSIQNTLLTIINEKIYRNGDKDINVPLLLLIAASNELPAAGEGLEALYDRFIIRLYVDNVSKKESFRKLIDTSTNKNDKIMDDEKLTVDEIKKIKEEAKKIRVDDGTFEFITTLKNKLNAELKENAPYISDRRWKKIVEILKVSAYVSGNKEIGCSEWILIQDMIWETTEQYERIRSIIFDTWVDSITSSMCGTSFQEANDFLTSIENKIKSKKVYKPLCKTINGEKYYSFKSSDSTICLKKDNVSFDSTNNIISINVDCYTDFYYIENKNRHLFTNYNSIQLITNNEIRYQNKSYKLEITEIEFKVDSIEEIESNLEDFYVIISKISDLKNEVLDEMKDTNSVFTNSYNYYVSKFDNEFNRNLNDLIKRRDDILYKIKKQKSKYNSQDDYDNEDDEADHDSSQTNYLFDIAFNN